jgi:hypothetical protein
MTPDQAHGGPIAIAILAIGLISLAALAYLTAPQTLRRLTGTDSPSSHSPAIFDLQHSSGDILLGHISGAEIPINTIILERAGQELEPCLSTDCPRNGTMRPGDQARVRCEPHGQHPTTVLLHGQPELTEALTCPG